MVWFRSGYWFRVTSWFKDSKNTRRSSCTCTNYTSVVPAWAVLFIQRFPFFLSHSNIKDGYLSQMSRCQMLQATLSLCGEVLGLTNFLGKETLWFTEGSNLCNILISPHPKRRFLFGIRMRLYKQTFSINRTFFVARVTRLTTDWKRWVEWKEKLLILWPPCWSDDTLPYFYLIINPPMTARVKISQHFDILAKVHVHVYLVHLKVEHCQTLCEVSTPVKMTGKSIWLVKALSGIVEGGQNDS